MHRRPPADCRDRSVRESQTSAHQRNLHLPVSAPTRPRRRLRPQKRPRRARQHLRWLWQNPRQSSRFKCIDICPPRQFLVNETRQRDPCDRRRIKAPCSVQRWSTFDEAGVSCRKPPLVDCLRSGRSALVLLRGKYRCSCGFLPPAVGNPRPSAFLRDFIAACAPSSYVGSTSLSSHSERHLTGA